MSTTGDPRPAILVVLWPCDRLDDAAALQAEGDRYIALAEARGWDVLGAAVLPMCPAYDRRDTHPATPASTFEQVFRLIPPSGEWSLLLTPPDPTWIPTGRWPDLLVDLWRLAKLEVLDADGDWDSSRTDAWLGPLDSGGAREYAARRTRPQARLGRRSTAADDDDRYDTRAVLGEVDTYDDHPAGTAPVSAGSPPVVLDPRIGISHRDQPFGSMIGNLHLGQQMAAGAGAATFGGSPPRSRPPTAGRTGPLPHDGLFVRRNNAFGTRPTLGIADLIDQGVLIDQTRIRFDDFIASNTDRIPAPDPGNAVAVSHGSSAVPDSFKAHDETTHLVEIALRAGEHAPPDQQAGEPLSVNFVFAVDVSLSMRGEKLGDAVVAIRELYAQLRDTDVLGIIVFNDQARTLLRATRKADLTEDQLGQLLAGTHASGGTDLNLGLSFAFDEIERFADPGTVNCVYLFSDGDPTSGETNWVTIRANVAARVRGDVTLSCFGFGSDARIPELRALAGVSGGHWTFVAQTSDVTSTLSDDLARRDSLAAINIQLRIDIPAAATIWHIYGHDLITDAAGRTAVHAEAAAARQRARDEYQVENLPDLIRDEQGIRIFAPDLAYGETYWVVLELQVPADEGFGTATVQYLDTFARDNRRLEVDLSAPGEIPPETVLTHGVGLWTSEVTFYALDDLYENDQDAATRRLKQHVQLLKAAYAAVPSNQFRDDRITLDKLVSLTANLGARRAFSEGPGAATGNYGYVVYAMNQFGRVRGGYLTQRSLGTR